MLAQLRLRGAPKICIVKTVKMTAWDTLPVEVEIPFDDASPLLGQQLTRKFDWPPPDAK